MNYELYGFEFYLKNLKTKFEYQNENNSNLKTSYLTNETIFNFDAINVTIGLPFIRVAPDHGPNAEMFGKNKSDPSSIFCAMEFFKKI